MAFFSRVRISGRCHLRRERQHWSRLDAQPAPQLLQLVFRTRRRSNVRWNRRSRPLRRRCPRPREEDSPHAHLPARERPRRSHRLQRASCHALSCNALSCNYAVCMRGFLNSSRWNHGQTILVGREISRKWVLQHFVSPSSNLRWIVLRSWDAVFGYFFSSNFPCDTVIENRWKLRLFVSSNVPPCTCDLNVRVQIVEYLTCVYWIRLFVQRTL